MGKLSFIDLAGSEKQKKTETDKEGLLEANAINQSLSALGLVISKLVEHQKDANIQIPYRSNILTKVMQDSLGGNSKTLMFVNCSPSIFNKDETKNSLEYAKRVKDVKNNVQVNVENRAIAKMRNDAQTQSSLITDMIAAMSGLEDSPLKEILEKHNQKMENAESEKTIVNGPK